MRRRPVPPLAALVVAAAVAAGGAGGGGRSSSAPAGAARAASTSTAAPAGATTLASVAPVTTAAVAVDHGDWVDERFDYGEITAVRARPGGGAELDLNRKQLHDDGGQLRSGSQWTYEPMVVGATDVPWVDDNPRTRRFVLAPGAEVLRLADPHPCADGSGPAQPTWMPIGVDAFVKGAWKDRLEDSLTFDRQGQVSRVRLSTDC